MSNGPALADPEIAAAKLTRDIEQVRGTSSAKRNEWDFRRKSDLYWMVRMFARRRDGGKDEYWIQLGAEFYDVAGPTVLFVDPEGNEVKGNSPWLPKLNPRPSWFCVHPDRDNKIHKGQLICFSYNAYYEFTHNPAPEHQRWKQGEHTVAATLYALQQALSEEHYECRLG